MRLGFVATWLVGVALSVCAGAARGGDAGWALRLAPADADLVVVVRGAKELRASEAGRAVEGAVRSLMGDGEMDRAWEMLAGRLGWTGAEAYDRLLGKCAMVVVRGVEGEARWALVSEVGHKTEAALRKRISMSPRTAMGDAVVLSVERGALELALSKGPDGARVVVAPQGERGLCREMVKRLGKGSARSMSSTEAVARLGDAAERAAVVAVVRGSCETSWGALAARVDGDRLTAHVAAGAGNVGPVDWSDRSGAAGTWVSLREGALLAVVEQTRAMEKVWCLMGPTLLMTQHCEEGRRFGAALRGWMGLGVYARDGGGLDVGAIASVGALTESARWGDGFAGNVFAAIGIEGQGFGGLEAEAERVVELGRSEALARTSAWLGKERARWSWRTGEDGAGWLAVGVGERGYRRAVRAVEESELVEGEARVVSMGEGRPRELVEALGRAGIPLGAVGEALRGFAGLWWEFRVDEGGVLSGRAGMRAWGE